MAWYSINRRGKEEVGVPLRLVVGLNRVDQILPEGWDARLNQPSESAVKQIQRRCENTIARLAQDAGIGRHQIEYYSALKRYRLHNLLTRVVEHSHAGFKFADVQPKHFEDVDGVDPDVREFTQTERVRRAEARTRGKASGGDRLLAELGRFLSRDDLDKVEAKFKAEMRRPPRVAVLGQAGVGKTTTVNALFATDWATNAVEVGTHQAQDAVVELPSGGMIQIVDLPGYGRSIEADEQYAAIYRETIPDCDLVLLVIQADRGDLVDDIEMIIQLKGLLSTSAIAESAR